MTEQMDRIDWAKDGPNVDNGITKEVVVEQVRVNLLRYLENNPGITRKVIAVGCGYSKRTIDNFIQRENISYQLAKMIVMVFPEVGDGMPCMCSHCGSLPSFPRK